LLLFISGQRPLPLLVLSTLNVTRWKHWDRSMPDRKKLSIN
jgi:hypothetical protein